MYSSKLYKYRDSNVLYISTAHSSDSWVCLHISKLIYSLDLWVCLHISEVIYSLDSWVCLHTSELIYSLDLCVWIWNEHSFWFFFKYSRSEHLLGF